METSVKKHILVISQYFYPEVFRINDICQEWVRRGYKVTVVTGIPNYPKGFFFEGYSYTKRRRENWNGIDIIRIPLIPRGQNSIGLILNYISFPISGFIWKCFTDIEADYIFSFETSPMTQVLIGCWYAKKKKIPHYLYVQDLWPENVEIVTGIHTPLIIRPIEKMVGYIYNNCDKIFGTSPSFVKEICKRGVPEGRAYYWPQYAEEFYRPSEGMPIPEIPSDDFFKIMFAGNVGYAQGLDILTETAVLLKQKGCKVRFYIVGDGRYKDTFIKEVRSKDVEDIILFLGRRPAEKIPDMLGACDAAFLSFMNNPLFEKTIPAKLQSYMACGKLIIAAASGETKQIIEEAQCGICSEIGDRKQLADSIENVMKMSSDKRNEMGRNALKYCTRHFNKSDLMDEMDKYFTI